MSRTYIGGLFIVVDVVDVPGQTKVGNLYDVALCDQDISGCQVSVYALERRVKKKQDRKREEGQRVEKELYHILPWNQGCTLFGQVQMQLFSKLLQKEVRHNFITEYTNMPG